jgi:hypothetical protein
MSEPVKCDACGGAGWSWGYSPERGQDDTRRFGKIEVSR